MSDMTEKDEQPQGPQAQPTDDPARGEAPPDPAEEEREGYRPLRLGITRVEGRDSLKYEDVADK